MYRAPTMQEKNRTLKAQGAVPALGGLNARAR